MLENVKVSQIKKFKKQSAFIFEFCFWEDPPHQSTGPQPIPKCISLKCIFPKCIYPKCISAKCIRLACLLSFASLFLAIQEPGKVLQISRLPSRWQGETKPIPANRKGL